MKVLGLTGGIATGKSTVAQMLRETSFPIFDADEAVHRLLAEDKATIQDIAAQFPGVEKGGAIDRQALGRMVFADAPHLAKLEAILHPRVRAQELAFLDAARAAGHSLAILEIPLLFETGAEALCDAVLVTDCPPELQKQRIMQRPGMTADKMARILSRQMNRQDRLRRADHVIDTGQPLEAVRQRVQEIVATL